MKHSKEEQGVHRDHDDKTKGLAHRQNPRDADFLDYLMEDDISESLALQALAKFDPDQKLEGTNTSVMVVNQGV